MCVVLVGCCCCVCGCWCLVVMFIDVGIVIVIVLLCLRFLCYRLSCLCWYGMCFVVCIECVRVACVCVVWFVLRCVVVLFRICVCEGRVLCLVWYC